MRFLLAASAAVAMFVLMTSIAFANASYKECKVVNNRAEINFDEALTVSIYEHRSTRFCSFDVHIGPRPANTADLEPSIVAARRFHQLAAAKPNDADVQWDVFVTALTNALVQPWRKGENNDQLATFQTTLAEQEAKTLRQCAIEAVLKSGPFERRSDVVSCGIVEGGSFVIEAVNEVIRLVLILPAPAAR